MSLSTERNDKAPVSRFSSSLTSVFVSMLLNRLQGLIRFPSTSLTLRPPQRFQPRCPPRCPPPSYQPAPSLWTPTVCCRRRWPLSTGEGVADCDVHQLFASLAVSPRIPHLAHLATLHTAFINVGAERNRGLAGIEWLDGFELFEQPVEC